jgi:hypothetical protein
VHLRAERLAAGLVAGLAACLAACLIWTLTSITRAATSAAPASAARAPAANAAPIGTYLSREEIRAAAAKLRADPNLAGEKTLRTLRWNEENQPQRATPPPRWLSQLIDFVAQSSSLVLWILGAVCAAIALVWAIRMLRNRVPGVAAAEHAVTTVQGLDIRPESLPENIGAAALELLEAGREREALSLLYRGALSRAVHRHGIAILPSATEGEALRAVNATLDPPRAAYFGDVVALWQRAVYAGERMLREPIDRLCRNFAVSFEGSAP